MPFILLFDFIILLLIRFFIKIVLTIFGWATNIFFGKLPDKSKVWFYLMIFLSFIWIYCLLAKFFPSMLAIFTGYFPEKSFTKVMSHILYIVCVIGIPPAVGALGAFIKGISREQKKLFIEWLLKGYWYSVVLGCSMAVILVCTPVIRIKRMLKHKTAKNISMGVAGKGNIRVMDEIIIALSNAGIKACKKVPSKIYSVPVKMMNGVMKVLFNYVSDREFYVTGEDLNIYINSSDIMIEGNPELIEKAQIAIVKAFVNNDIFLTESPVAQNIEMQVQNIFKCWKNESIESHNALAMLQELAKFSSDEGMTYDEWALLCLQISEAQNRILAENAVLKGK